LKNSYLAEIESIMKKSPDFVNHDGVNAEEELLNTNFNIFNKTE
jgi:hypothetical protein